tara:strand:- start:3150 stop:3524 length:375 start_codon:yes stop_codon:yes gene_type:complete
LAGASEPVQTDESEVSLTQRGRVKSQVSGHGFEGPPHVDGPGALEGDAGASSGRRITILDPSCAMAADTSSIAMGRAKEARRIFARMISSDSISSFQDDTTISMPDKARNMMRSPELGKIFVPS